MTGTATLPRSGSTGRATLIGLAALALAWETGARLLSGSFVLAAPACTVMVRFAASMSIIPAMRSSESRMSPDVLSVARTRFVPPP